MVRSSAVAATPFDICRQEEIFEEDPCGMLDLAEEIIPFECLGADRQKSKAFFDACNEIVEEQGWSFAQLQACGMLEAGYRRKSS